MSLQHLKDITNNFCTEGILGKGGFAVVYKVSLIHVVFFSSKCKPYLTQKTISILIRACIQGVLENGKMVAVKKLAQSMLSSHEQFENEVTILIKLKHPNIVQLVGYFYEKHHLCERQEGKSIFAWRTEFLLCLECMPNGSLDMYISGITFKYGTIILSLILIPS